MSNTKNRKLIICKKCISFQEVNLTGYCLVYGELSYRVNCITGVKHKIMTGENLASHMRSASGECGPDGKLYKSRISFLLTQKSLTVLFAWMVGVLVLLSVIFFGLFGFQLAMKAIMGMF